MIQAAPNLSVDVVGEIVRNAVAPVFLLSGIGAFLNVCASRLSRIVDLVAICESLAHEQVPDDVVAELIELVRATVDYCGHPVKSPPPSDP